MIREFKKRSEKKAVSEMMGYVILIAITIGVAVSVAAWLKYYPNMFNPPADCNDDTSIIVNNYACAQILTSVVSPGGPVLSTSNYLSLYIKNNGLFNIGGFILKVSNNISKVPTENLLAFYPEGAPFFLKDMSTKAPKGYYLFASKESEPTLKPGEVRQTIFFMEGNISKIIIQPWILDAKGNRLLCSKAVIAQELKNCYNSTQ
jgi:hypothetical protein